MAVRPDQPIKIVLEYVQYFVFLFVYQFYGSCALNVVVRPDQPVKIVLH